MQMLAYTHIMVHGFRQILNYQNFNLEEGIGIGSGGKGLKPLTFKMYKLAPQILPKCILLSSQHAACG